VSHLEGERHDGDGVTQPAIRHVQGATRAYARAVVALDAVDGSGTITTYYLWIDHDGTMRRSTTYPAETHAADVGGDAV
jgi:hypothetical protein